MALLHKSLQKSIIYPRRVSCHPTGRQLRLRPYLSTLRACTNGIRRLHDDFRCFTFFAHNSPPFRLLQVLRLFYTASRLAHLGRVSWSVTSRWSSRNACLIFDSLCRYLIASLSEARFRRSTEEASSVAMLRAGTLQDDYHARTAHSCTFGDRTAYVPVCREKNKCGCNIASRETPASSSPVRGLSACMHADKRRGGLSRKVDTRHDNNSWFARSNQPIAGMW